MATSFAAFASQFLNRQQNPEASLASSQPLFFSFTTDDGSRAGNNVDTDLDDVDDPHLRYSSGRSQHIEGDDDEDPYLRLDEDDRPPGTPRYAQQSTPLLSLRPDPSSSTQQDSPKGWLTHQARLLRSPSPAPSTSSDNSGPPPDIFHAHHRQQPPPPLQTRAPISLSLTESLLPRDGRTRPIDVFSLPDPRHMSRGRRKYNDSIWTAIWCSGLILCLISCILILFLTRKPSTTPPITLPYTTLLHTVPLLTILTFLSALVAYTHIFLLRIFVQPVMIATSVFIPATLLVSAIWAFVGSFMWDAGQEPTWGETVGLRLFSIVPLVLAIVTARRLVNLPRDIHMTSSTLTLTTRLLLANPFLLALSPAILLVALLGSIPFLTLIFRLLLIGYFSHPAGGAWEWHVKGWADWAIAITVAIWLWSWGVARGVLRVTCAGVIGAWYFADLELPPPDPTSTHTIHAALTRSTTSSLGTIVLSALILTSLRLLALLTAFFRAAPSYLPLPMRPFVHPLTIGTTMAVGWLDNVTTALSKYALVYTGLTGDPFFPSARRARALSAAIEAAPEGKYLRKFKSEPPLTLLTIAPLTLTFPFTLITYLFVAHTLGAPDQALGAAVLAGAVTALVGLFCVGLVKDTADTLYICYCIDKDAGERRRKEVFNAFEYDRERTAGQRRPPSSQPRVQTPHSQPAPIRVLQPQSEPEHSPPHQPSPAPAVAPRAASPPAIEPEPELDPFVHDLEAQSNSRHTATPYRLPASPLPDSDEDEDGDGSQFFPGSGLF